VLDGCAAVEAVWIPQVNMVSTQTLETHLACLGDKRDIATKPKIAVV
jgi:hypothetical protein